MTTACAGHRPALLSSLVLLAGTISASAIEQSATGLEFPIVFAQIPADESASRPACADGMLRCGYGAGGRIVRLDPDGRIWILTEGFENACELAVSFDAKRILFAAKRRSFSPWNIWEMNPDGRGAVRITNGAGNCRSPAYQASLYTIDSAEPWSQIMFVSDLVGRPNEYGAGRTTDLYSCRMNGSGLQRLTFNLSNDMDPLLMPDGRVLLASWQRMDLRRGPRGRVSLFGLNTDGTDYALFCGDQGLRVKHMPCVTPDGLVVFVEADHLEWDGAGRLAGVTLRRNFYSHRPLAEDAEWLYHSPSALPDGSVLVSRRPSDGSGAHALCRFDPKTGEIRTLFDDPAYHNFHARALVPRPQPDGRSSVVNQDYTTGKLYCLNAYLTDPKRRAHMQPGMIRAVRVIEGVSETRAGSREQVFQDRKRVLGVVPVEADGSFNLEVPADLPLQIQTLDENGLALDTCGWIWAKRRESRGCIGCHEDPELTPENRMVDAVRQPSVQVPASPAARRSVDFNRDLMPVISAKCAAAACHGGPTVEPRLTDEPEPGGATNVAYQSLLADVSKTSSGGESTPGRYVQPGRARTSPLVWRLYGRNTSRPWDDSYDPDLGVQPHPPPGSEPLTAEELATFVEWIDLGAPWQGATLPQEAGAQPPVKRPAEESE